MDFDKLILNQELLFEKPHADLLEQMFKFFEDKQILKKQIKSKVLKLDEMTILRILKIVNFMFHQHPQKNDIFLFAYQSIVLQYSKSGKQICNTFALMLYNLNAYRYLQLGEIHQAKVTLKKCKKYINSDVETNPVILGLCILNLSCIYLNESKYQRSFIWAYRALEILQPYMRRLKQKESKSIKQDMVVMVNTYFLLSQSLNQHLKSNSFDIETQKHYLKYFENFTSRGYKTSVKFLGQQSAFTKMFTQQFSDTLKKRSAKQLSLQLPIIKYQSSTESQATNLLFKNLLDAIQRKVNPKLQQIHNYLLSSNIPRTHEVRPISPPKLPKFNLENQELLHDFTRIYDQYEVNVKLYKGTKNLFGQTLITISTLDHQQICAELLEEKVISILLNQINLNDTKPYQTDISSCTPEQFIRYYLLPYIQLENDKLCIWPKSVGLLPEKKIIFLDEDCYVFVNYIQDNIFRVSISPYCLYTSVYVTLEIKQSLMCQLIAGYTVDLVDKSVSNIIKIVSNDAEQPILSTKSTIERNLKLENLRILQTEVNILLRKTEEFLEKHKFNSGKKYSIFGNINLYFKYEVQQFAERACIHSLKNLEKQESFEIISQNTYETFGATCKINAKGYSRYDYFSILQDFGIVFKRLEKINEKMEIYDMVLKKYYLHIFEEQLLKEDKEFYGQNAMKEFPVLCKMFKRSYVNMEYDIPITAALITIRGDEPVGIKITGFDVHSCIEKGIFLKINHRKWLKKGAALESNIKPPPTKQSMLAKKVLGKFMKSKEDPGIIVNYHLNTVLNKIGFQILLRSVQFSNESRNMFFMRDRHNEQVKWTKLQCILTLEKVKEALITRSTQ